MILAARWPSRQAVISAVQSGSSVAAFHDRHESVRGGDDGGGGAERRERGRRWESEVANMGESIAMGSCSLDAHLFSQTDLVCVYVRIFEGGVPRGAYAIWQKRGSSVKGLSGFILPSSLHGSAGYVSNLGFEYIPDMYPMCTLCSGVGPDQTQSIPFSVSPS